MSNSAGELSVCEVVAQWVALMRDALANDTSVTYSMLQTWMEKSLQVYETELSGESTLQKWRIEGSLQNGELILRCRFKEQQLVWAQCRFQLSDLNETKGCYFDAIECLAANAALEQTHDSICDDNAKSCRARGVRRVVSRDVGEAYSVWKSVDSAGLLRVAFSREVFETELRTAAQV